jgi:predicted PurR-regulated permease PerM
MSIAAGHHIVPASDSLQPGAVRRPLRATSAVPAWIAFAGCVLVVAVLYWAQALLVPIALAGLLAFLLEPVVTILERAIGRVVAVLSVVAIATAVIGFAGWIVLRQASSVVEELPTYRTNIRHKIADLRWLQHGGTVEKLQKTVDDIKAQMAAPDEGETGTLERPVVVSPEPTYDLWGMPSWIGSVFEPLATAGLVLVLVIFILIEREDIRTRLLQLFGSGTLAVTTKALDEAATRVSRYLLRMSGVNLMFACGVAAGLTLIGVPYALLWGVLAGALRFIPYVGIWVGAGAPLAVSLAALPGWQGALLVIGLFLVIEIFTTVVLETFLYADAAGISQVALLVAVAFWAWLWGAPGLLLATPLTVCTVVLGKHVPGLRFLATLMADLPPLEPSVRVYERLLTRDYTEAAALVEEQAQQQGAESVYDTLLVPVLAYAERDLLEERLTPDDEREVVDAARELVQDLAPAVRGAGATDRVAKPAGMDRRVLTVAIDPVSDHLALEMLGTLLERDGIGLDAAPPRLLPSELVTVLQSSAHRILCIADVPPSPPSKTRYLVKKLHAALPDLSILVGRWAPPALRDESHQPLIDAGATAVAATLLETRDQLLKLIDTPTPQTDLAPERPDEPARALAR